MANVTSNKKKNNYFAWLFIAMSILLIASLGARIYFAKKNQVNEQQKQELSSLGFYMFDQPRVLAPVLLTNLSGEEKTFAEHAGSTWRIVNAGYLSCPDICPINLSLLNSVKEQWESNTKAFPFNVIHITFDPARDRPELLKRYLSFVNPTFYGLTGSVENIQRLINQLNMVFIHEKPDENGHYFITHSDSMALINPEGQYVGLFKGPYQMDHIMEVLQNVIQ